MSYLMRKKKVPLFVSSRFVLFSEGKNGRKRGFGAHSDDKKTFQNKKV
jgi:hypothetical protein